jgi:hypothetical protein
MKRSNKLVAITVAAGMMTIGAAWPKPDAHQQMEQNRLALIEQLEAQRGPQAMTTQNRSGAYQPQATALDNLLTRLYNGEGVSPDEINAARRR